MNLCKKQNKQKPNILLVRNVVKIKKLENLYFEKSLFVYKKKTYYEPLKSLNKYLFCLQCQVLDHPKDPPQH